MSAKRVTQLSTIVDEKLYIIGMSRAEFAETIGISPNYLCMVLRGDYNPSIALTERMAESLEMNAREIREIVLKKAM